MDKIRARDQHFSYAAIVVTTSMKFLAVVTPPYIYHSFSTQKTFQQEKFTPMNARSCGQRNVKKHRKIKNSELYIALDIYLKIDFMQNREFTSSGSRYYVVRSCKCLTASLTLSTKRLNKKQKEINSITDIPQYNFRKLLKKFNNVSHLCHKKKHVHIEPIET